MSNVMETNTVPDNESTMLSYNDIAKKLLKDRLLLTALELHTELMECGKEVKQLKDFFSNPANFESQSIDFPSKISRSGSQTTLDSLDFTRYSEDGERGTDERIAVLEFELRKAKETINALRNNLTVATESEKNTPNKSNIKLLNSDTIKPHEKRVLNFLVNEYLLLQGYKLTSITFADENEDQDFEDWDDVGLNIAKPVELLTLYREGLNQRGYNTTSTGIQTDFINDSKKYKDIIEELTKENDILNTRITSLQNEVKILEEEKVKLDKQIEASSLKSREIKSCSNISSKTSTIGSDSPEHFEIIEKTNSDDNVSNASLNVNDWTKVNISKAYIDASKVEKSLDMDEKYKTSTKNLSKFKNALERLCPENIPQKIENDILENILNNSSTTENFIDTVSQSLLRIIPNVILNKREEVIPLLISAVHLNANSDTRDKLLQQLFNLKKKPSNVERSLILTGILGIAKYCPESVVENEILPQCWEQLTHKHVERRLLVVEACRVLIPYVSSPIRNSLLLSMLQQMLEDKEELVRDEVIKVLSFVVAYCDDVDKYAQCEELAFNTLKDSSAIVVESTIKIYFPVLAKWSLDIDRLKSTLIKNLLQKLNDSLKYSKNDSPSKNKILPEIILRITTTLNHLLPFIIMNVASNDIVLNRIEKDMKIDLRPEFLNICTNMTHPSNFYDSCYDVGMILYEFNQLYEDDNDLKWEELNWIIDIVLPDLLNSLNLVDITQHELLQSFIDLFSNLCISFGKNFTLRKIRPLFEMHVQNLEQILSSFNQYSPSLNIIPVYLVSVLSYCDIQEASNVLMKFLSALPLCGTPLDCLEITVRGLCNLDMQEIVVSSLWDGVVHQRPLVRAVTAGLFATIVGYCNETILNSKVTPALVTLANDTDTLVRTATIPALGCLITNCTMKELHDKSYMQLQMFLSDPTTKENHTLLRQLVVTMGQIVAFCNQKFRQDVILPQLNTLSNYMNQMTSQTRKVDMAVALIEAYSNIVYNSFNNNIISNLLLPGLRYLEQAVNENSTLLMHKDALNSMIKECENKLDLSNAQLSIDRGNKITQNVNQGVEEMKQRVSKIFNKPQGAKPPSLSNLQGFFKKK